MKTQIQYTKSDGDNGVALIHGPVTNLEQAKQELANKLNLPDDSSPKDPADLDARLRRGGIDPATVVFDQISE
jgi:hypothetical protein